MTATPHAPADVHDMGTLEAPTRRWLTAESARDDVGAALSAVTCSRTCAARRSR
jgi:hypothetical protein